MWAILKITSVIKIDTDIGGGGQGVIDVGLFKTDVSKETLLVGV